MSAVRSVQVQRVDAVEHVEQVFFGIDAGLLDPGQCLADDLLARGCVRYLHERFEMRNQVAVDEAEEVAELARLQRLALGAIRRRPVAPAGLEGGRKSGADPLRLSSWLACSWSSRTRRNRIQVNSGTYCIAPAHFERRSTSQIDQMAEFGERRNE